MKFFWPLWFLLTSKCAECGEDVPGNLTDVSLCKLSRLGLDYVGSIGKTESGVRCQSWTATNPLHKVDPNYTDETFSDFSKAKAKNYCRNPNRDPTGPWCYTMAPDNIYETCGVPLCSFTECRVTGPGMEYAGKHKTGISGRACLKWNKNRSKIKYKNELRSQEKFHPSLFPDETLSSAKKFCRNPDADPGGPWCYVDVEDSSEVQREYCDVPFCDDASCTLFTRPSATYTHYYSFPETQTNFTFGLKLWRPDSYMDASATVLLTLFALPVSARDVEDLGAGVEIYVSNRNSSLRSGNKDKPEYEDTPGVIKSHEFTYFSLTWWQGIITLFKEGRKTPVFLAEYKHKGNALGFHKNKFRFYSAQGTGVIWSFPFCDDCVVHVTTGGEFLHFARLRETSVGFELQFHLRAFHSATILLTPSPAIDHPHLKLTIQGADNYTRLLYSEYEGGPTVVLKETNIPKLINYWSWREFNLGVFVNALDLYVTKETGAHSLFQVKHDGVKLMRWFSPGSQESTARWTFFCYPPKESAPPLPFPPECALDANEANYNGTQDVTAGGHPCIPWSGEKLLPQEARGSFPEGEELYGNYCRDPRGARNGSYCYTLSTVGGGARSKKEYCKVRKCKSAECRMAGTGNDYIGKVGTTRSNRTCQHWYKKQEQAETGDPNLGRPPETLYRLNSVLEERGCADKWRCLRDIVGGGVNNHSAELQELMHSGVEAAAGQEAEENVNETRFQVHQVDAAFLNGTLYADMDVEKAENYCRNPSRSVAGYSETPSDYKRLRLLY